MVKSVNTAMRMLEKGATIERRWGGWIIQLPQGGGKKSILPTLVTQLEDAGKIHRIDDRTSCVGEKWVKAGFCCGQSSL